MSRYIDADALIMTIRELPNTPNGFSDVYDKAYIIGVIEELPTADVVPSRFGCGSAPYCSDVFEVDEDE